MSRLSQLKLSHWFVKENLMPIATIKMSPGNLDDVKLLIRGEHPELVFIKDRDSAYELCRVVMVAYFEDYQGPLNVSIDGSDFNFSQSVWQALYSEFDQSFEAYLNYCDELPEVIPLFPVSFFPKSES
jgi:hypothetical protein